MKALALTFSGMTKVCSEEIKELIGVKGKETKEGVIFEAEIKQILTIAYKSQSAVRVLALVSEGKIENLSIPEEYLKGTISIVGKSTTKARELSDYIEAKKVYKNADVNFYLYFEDDYCWLGIDLGDDMSKREYRIFVGSETLKGNTAFAALKLAKYEPKQVLLDPFCRAGSIAIEAALSAIQMSPRFYSKTKFSKAFETEKQFEMLDKKIKNEITGKIIALSPQFPSVQATKKNSKIAGVGKTIDFSRTDIDWLDLKFEKNSIDRIITQPVELSKGFPAEKFQKSTLLFFERAKPILKKSGKIGLILRKGMEEYISAAKIQGFSLESQNSILQGKETWNVLVFTA